MVQPCDCYVFEDPVLSLLLFLVHNSLILFRYNSIEHLWGLVKNGFRRSLMAAYGELDKPTL